MRLLHQETINCCIDGGGCLVLSCGIVSAGDGCSSCLAVCCVHMLHSHATQCSVSLLYHFCLIQSGDTGLLESSTFEWNETMPVLPDALVARLQGG